MEVNETLIKKIFFSVHKNMEDISLIKQTVVYCTFHKKLTQAA